MFKSTDKRSNEVVRIRVVEKNGSSTRFQEMDTEIGTCLPIHVVVFVFFKDSSWTHIDSKSNIAKFLKSFC